jgi:hypothetical protein
MKSKYNWIGGIKLKIKKEWRSAKGITPQSLETNDGTWGIKIVDDDFFELYHYDKEVGVDDKINFDSEELETLINILTAARNINPFTFEAIQKHINNKK